MKGKRNKAAGMLFFAAAAVPISALASPPQLPSIPSGPGHQFLVTNAPYNAVGDGTTDNTQAIQQAITDCGNAGGGTVEIPAGTATGVYMCGLITLPSNVNLQVDLRAILRNTTPSNTFITTSGATGNIEISGGGAIDNHATAVSGSNMI